MGILIVVCMLIGCILRFQCWLLITFSVPGVCFHRLKNRKQVEVVSLHISACTCTCPETINQILIIILLKLHFCIQWYYYNGGVVTGATVMRHLVLM